MYSWFFFKVNVFSLFQARYSMKYDHKNGLLKLKITDDNVCLIYKTEVAQDLKKIDKFVNNLMRHMTTFE